MQGNGPAGKSYAVPVTLATGIADTLVCYKIFVSQLGGNGVKTLQKVCAAMVLSLTFSLSALAGDIHSPGVAAPVSTTCFAGDIHCPGAAS